MVRLQLGINLSEYTEIEKSQFHYGSITTRTETGVEVEGFGLNSTMVRLQHPNLIKFLKEGTGLNSTMVRLQHPNLIKFLKEGTGLNSTMVRLQQGRR